MRQRDPRRGDWIEWTVLAGAAVAVAVQLALVVRQALKALS